MDLPKRKRNRLNGYDYSQNGWFKYQTTKQINLLRNSSGERVWQRSFHDHVIRGQRDYEEIWTYIDAPPSDGSLIVSTNVIQVIK